jgi:hypothetical protein
MRISSTKSRALTVGKGTTMTKEKRKNLWEMMMTMREEKTRGEMMTEKSNEQTETANEQSQMTERGAKGLQRSRENTTMDLFIVI